MKRIIIVLIALAAFVVAGVVYNSEEIFEGEVEETENMVKETDVIEEVVEEKEEVEVQPITTEIQEQADLTYATIDGRDLKLDLYVPEGPGPHPLIIFAHPGAFFMGDKGDMSKVPALTSLYDDGKGQWAIASFNYRLSKQATWPAQIQDSKAAVRWLRANAGAYNLDPDMFVSWGNSAGGKLAVMLEVTEGSDFHEDLSMGNEDVSSNVQGVVDWYGPVDALYILEEALMNPGTRESPHVALLGCNFDTCDLELMESATARTMIDGNESPILIMHGEEDEAVNVANSKALVAALAEFGADYTVYYLTGVGHGSDPAWRMPEEYGKVHEFLEGLLE
jgi:acetyl esterase/lipase